MQPDRAIALSLEAEEALIAAIRAGQPLRAALRAVRVSPSAFYEWLAIARDDAATWHTGAPIGAAVRADCARLAERVQDAQDQLQAEMVGAIRAAAITPNEKTGLPDWRAADALLTKHPAYRGDWRPEHQLEVRHSGTVEHRLADATDAELHALAGWDDVPAFPPPD